MSFQNSLKFEDEPRLNQPHLSQPHLRNVSTLERDILSSFYKKKGRNSKRTDLVPPRKRFCCTSQKCTFPKAPIEFWEPRQGAFPRLFWTTMNTKRAAPCMGCLVLISKEIPKSREHQEWSSLCCTSQNYAFPNAPMEMVEVPCGRKSDLGLLQVSILTHQPGFLPNTHTDAPCIE
jgi:hypothetical protein